MCPLPSQPGVGHLRTDTHVQRSVHCPWKGGLYWHVREKPLVWRLTWQIILMLCSCHGMDSIDGKIQQLSSIKDCKVGYQEVKYTVLWKYNTTFLLIFGWYDQTFFSSTPLLIIAKSDNFIYQNDLNVPIKTWMLTWMPLICWKVPLRNSHMTLLGNW